jgi:hypothetical protein
MTTVAERQPSMPSVGHQSDSRELLRPYSTQIYVLQQKKPLQSVK